MLRVADFKPHYVVVSLGIDTFLGDPLGDFCLTRRGYSSIGEIISALQEPTMYTTSPPSLPPSLPFSLPSSLPPSLPPSCFIPPLCAFLTRLCVRYVMEGGYVVPELGNNVAEVLMGHERSAGI